MPIYILDRGEIKAEARGLLRTAQVPPLRFTALFLVIDLVLSEISALVDYFVPNVLEAPFGLTLPEMSFSFIGILIALLNTVLMAGYACYCLGVHRGREMPYESMFDAFPYAGKVILLELLEALLIGVGLFLFIVPGVVLALCYATSLYHLCEEPEIGVIEAMRRGRSELRGYKLQLLFLLLSFLPLLLLVSLPVMLVDYFLMDAFSGTLGGVLAHNLVLGVLAAFASLYVTPYLSLAQVGFYRRVTAGGAWTAGRGADGTGGPDDEP